MNHTEKDHDQIAIDTIRTLSMDAVQAANSGHPGTPMALAPLGWLIFSRLRKHAPADPTWVDRDRFVLSCGHASMLQYALLHLSGYDLTLSDIKRFRQWDSRTPGHPESFVTPGVETTTGPLGQGIANAVGMAMAERHLAARFNRPGHGIVDHRTWVIASDGDLMEGVCAEAASLAGHLRLGKLIAFWDDNHITIDGTTDITFTENVPARFEAQGWHVTSVDDGNDLQALERAAREAIDDHRPSLVRVRTIIGYPAPNRQDTPAAHGAPLGQDEVDLTKLTMGVPTEPFFVPEQVQTMVADLRVRGMDQRQRWQRRFDAYKKEYPALAQALVEGDPPINGNPFVTLSAGDGPMATRKASGVALAELAERVPSLVGGSADLSGSNNSYLKGLGEFGAGAGDGIPRNVHFGIREHAMASACNGMALHGGVTPYCATFLVFSDYMRPAIRLAALMKLSTKFVFTHDSIGLGEDGPTHQPVEHLAALRAIPNLRVYRPADANEVFTCWHSMMVHEGPAALVLTRQALPILPRDQYPAMAHADRGAYVLSDPDGDPDVVLIATGSEVHLALTALEPLAKQGIGVRLVSMPCWERFLDQPRKYQDRILPPHVRPRVVVEAGVRMGWERFVGASGGYVTLDRFGASAPAPTLFHKFGFNTRNIVATVKRTLSRHR